MPVALLLTMLMLSGRAVGQEDFIVDPFVLLELFALSLNTIDGLRFRFFFFFATTYQVFEGIVKELLVKNGHRATVESVPNTELEAAIDGKEKGKLDEVKKSMSDQVNK